MTASSLVACLVLTLTPLAAADATAASSAASSADSAQAALLGASSGATLRREPSVPAGQTDADPDQVPTDGVWPLVPAPRVVARPFDPPTSRWSAGHRGVDLVGRLGGPVRSSLAGRVSFVGRIAGRGVVVVDHGSVRTTYEPVSADVARGDLVGTGDRLGTLELFGGHCLPRVCLHWGLRRGDEYLDPLMLVGAAPGPVRLLPLGSAAATVPRVRPGGVPARRPSGAGPW